MLFDDNILFRIFNLRTSTDVNIINQRLKSIDPDDI